MASSTPSPDTFATRLDAARRVAGLSGRALAREMEVDKSTVVHWLNGAYLPRQACLNKLAAVLGVSVGALLGEIGTTRATTSAAISDDETDPDFASESDAVLRELAEADALVARLATHEIRDVATAVVNLAPQVLDVLAEAEAYAKRRRL